MVTQNRLKPIVDRQNYDVGYSDGWLDGYGEGSYRRWECAGFMAVASFAAGLICAWVMR